MAAANNKKNNTFGLDTVRETVHSARAEYVDNTEGIRQARNAGQLRKDVNTIMAAIVRRATARGKVETHGGEGEQVVAALTEEDLDGLLVECRESAKFLFEEMPIVFAKLFKNQLDVPIFFQLLDVLESVERGERDQNEASECVGRLLHRSFIQGDLPTVHLTKKPQQAATAAGGGNGAETEAGAETGAEVEAEVEEKKAPTLTWAQHCASRNGSVIQQMQQAQHRKETSKAKLRAAIQQKQQSRTGDLAK